MAKAEGIPEKGFDVPYITEFLEKLPRMARLTEVTFDQDFTNTLYKVLESYALTVPNKSTVYPVLDGPPGASKSLVAMVAAALLNLPVYTVTGADTSADEIKIDLLGGDNANSKDILGLAKNYIYHGWLSSPMSLKLAAVALDTAETVDAIPHDVLNQIAAYEQIKDNITAYSPGKFQLAARHGGILFLDELNGFKGVTTILTQLLENYTTELHPNFFIVGALNPAGEKHERDPLPPEIRSRVSTVYVNAPTEKSYLQMLQYLFSGVQPTIQLPTDTRGSITPAMLGVTIPPRTPGLLQQNIQEESFLTFMRNLAKAHKQIEQKYEDGVLDPKISATPRVDETTSVDRRMLTRAINSLDTYLSLFRERKKNLDAIAPSVTWDEYNQERSPDSLSKVEIVDAICAMLQRIYLDPFNFPISEEIKIDKSQTKKFSLASEYVTSILEFNHLTRDKLLAYIKTDADLEQLRVKWEAFMDKTDLTAKEKTVLLKTAIAGGEMPSGYHTVIRKSDTSTPQLLDLTYLESAQTRANLMESEYPKLGLRSSVAPAKIIAERASRLQDNKRRLITLDEFKTHTKALQAVVNQVRVNGICLIPLLSSDKDMIQLAIRISPKLLPASFQKAKPNEYLTKLISLCSISKGHPVNHGLQDLLDQTVKQDLGEESIKFAEIDETYVLELTVPV